jgi:hypothetical protein
MGFIPEIDQIDWSYLNVKPSRGAVPACLFCAERPSELFLLPTFGLADAHEAAGLACGDCYQQITFTAPRPAARVVFAAR